MKIYFFTSEKTIQNTALLSERLCLSAAPPPFFHFQQRGEILFVEQGTNVRLKGTEAVFIIVDCSRQLLKATGRTVKEVCVRLDGGVVRFQLEIVGVVIIFVSES